MYLIPKSSGPEWASSQGCGDVERVKWDKVWWCPLQGMQVSKHFLLLSKEDLPDHQQKWNHGQCLKEDVIFDTDQRITRLSRKHTYSFSPSPSPSLSPVHLWACKCARAHTHTHTHTHTHEKNLIAELNLGASPAFNSCFQETARKTKVKKFGKQTCEISGSPPWLHMREF